MTQPAPNHHLHSHSLSAQDGRRLHVRDWRPAQPTDRMPVLCLHGLTRNGSDFEPLAAALADERRVIAPDMRGRGLSEPDPNPAHYALPTYCGDVLDIAAALGIGKAVLIGTSMGGLMTMALAALRPTLLAGAVLNDVGPEIGKKGLQRIRSQLGSTGKLEHFEQAVAAAREANHKELPDLDDEGWMAFARRTFRQNEDGSWESAYDKALLKPAFAGSNRGATAWPQFNALAGTPLLLIQGALSDILTDEIVARMHEARPDMQRVRLDNRGHAPLLDEPPALAAIRDFLAALDPAREADIPATAIPEYSI